VPIEEPFPCLRGKVPKADGGALGVVHPIKAKALTSHSAVESRALRESLFFERQRKVTKRKPP
jgi:hypothetical protein